MHGPEIKWNPAWIHVRKHTCGKRVQNMNVLGKIYFLKIMNNDRNSNTSIKCPVLLRKLNDFSDKQMGHLGTLWGCNNSTSFLSCPLKQFSALEKSFSTIHKMFSFIHFTILLLLNRIFSLYLPLPLVQNTVLSFKGHMLSCKRSSAHQCWNGNYFENHHVLQ